MVSKAGIPTLSNFRLGFEPKTCEWFFPKNDCGFFVPPDKPVMIYFKLKMGGKQETEIGISYYNTVLNEQKTYRLAINKESAGDLIHMIARQGITNL